MQVGRNSCPNGRNTAGGGWRSLQSEGTGGEEGIEPRRSGWEYNNRLIEFEHLPTNEILFEFHSRQTIICSSCIHKGIFIAKSMYSVLHSLLYSIVPHGNLEL